MDRGALTINSFNDGLASQKRFFDRGVKGRLIFSVSDGQMSRY